MGMQQEKGDSTVPTLVKNPVLYSEDVYIQKASKNLIIENIQLNLDK